MSFTAPIPDVVRVGVTHFAGQDRKPDFVLMEGESELPVIAEDDEALTFTSGALTARIAKGPRWSLDFLAEGRRLTGSGTKAMAAIDTAEGGHFVREQLDLAMDAFVYGLGERFGPLVKNGQSVDSWNADGGTASEQAYKNVPFFLTNAGYGVFVNHPGRVSFEVASEAVARAQFSVEGQELEYFLIYGPTPQEILGKYTALTGRPPRVPAWSYGLWLSTSFTTDYDEATVGGFIDEMVRRDLPLSVFHFDSFWMREFNWCDFEWDPRTFPDPRGMLERLKARGLRICVWINPYIAQRSPLFAEAKAAGYLLKRANGDVWQWDLWQPGLAVVDFTNPEARQWYAASWTRWSRWAWTVSSPISASASRPTWSTPTALIPSACTTSTPTTTTKSSSSCCASGAARARRWCSPARRRPARSSSRCTGAGTASPRSRRWPRACAAGCRWVCAGSATGATTSAASRDAGSGGVQTLDRLRVAVLAQPAARPRVLPRSLAVRRGGGGRAANFTKLKARLMPYLLKSAEQVVGAVFR